MFSYDNIGGKIKSCAVWIFTVEAILAIIGGFMILLSDEDMILAGILVIVLGPIAAWISSWFLYGFGQLVENSDIVAAEYNRKNEKYEKVAAKNAALEQKRNAEKEVQRREKAKEIIENPEISEDEFVDITCPKCKEELSYTKEQLQGGEATCPMCDAKIIL